jgi:hypothetical protein
MPPPMIGFAQHGRVGTVEASRTHRMRVTGGEQHRDFRPYLSCGLAKLITVHAPGHHNAGEQKIETVIAELYQAAQMLTHGRHLPVMPTERSASTTVFGACGTVVDAGIPVGMTGTAVAMSQPLCRLVLYLESRGSIIGHPHPVAQRRRLALRDGAQRHLVLDQQDRSATAWEGLAILDDVFGNLLAIGRARHRRRIARSSAWGTAGSDVLDRSAG